MQNERTTGRKGAILAAVAASVIGTTRLAHAASYTWTSLLNNGGSWSDASNWAGNTPPPVNGSSTTDVSIFSSSIAFTKNADLTLNLSDDQTGSGTSGTFTLYSLDLEGQPQTTGGGSATVTITGATLNVVNGTSGTAQINLDANTGSHDTVAYNVASNVVLGNDTAFQGNGTAGFTFSGVISGNAGMIKTGSSSITLAGANTFSGQTQLQAGGITLKDASALQNSTLSYTGGTLSFDGLSGETLGGLAGSSNISLSSTAPAFLLSVGNNNSSTSYSGVLSNTGSLTKTGTGTLTLSGANTYTGVTTISGGTLSVSSLANGGSASGIGQSTNAAANLVINGGTLQYTGGSTSTNRQFTLGTSGGTLDASGSGAVNFTSTVAPILSGTNTARTLTLTGTNSGVNTLAAAVGDNGTGATSISKTGTGTWLLTSANTYTGPTTINAGTLNVTGSGSINTSNIVNLNGGSLTLASALARGNTQTLMGQGTITGTVNLNNGSTLQVGQTHNNAGGTASTLTVTGNAVFSGTTTLNLDLFSASTADKFVTNGAMTFSGTLNLTSPTGFPFAGGQSWDLLDFASHTGTFTGGVNLPTLGAGMTWNQTNLYTTGVVSIDTTITAGHYTLSLTATNPRVISGGSTSVTPKVTNSGSGINDSVAYSSLAANDAAATITGATGSGTLSLSQSGTVSQTFSSTTTGVHTVTPSATVNNATITGSATPDGTSSALITVVANRTVSTGSVSLGRVMVNQTATGNTTLSTSGDDNHFTHVTVAGAASGAVAVAGGPTVFNANGQTASWSVSGSFTSSGAKSGSVPLGVTGEGLTGEIVNAVSVPYTATALNNRMITASSASLGRVMVNQTATGSSNLSTSGDDNNYTHVTVGSGSSGGVSATGGPTLFNSNGQTATWSVSGSFTSSGTKSGSVGLSVTGEGLAGEVDNAVSVPYTATALNNRTVSSDSVALGRVMVGQAVSGSSTLSTTGDDNNYTRVTVGNGSSGGLSTSGVSALLNSASSTASRSVSGSFTSSGVQSGSIGLSVTGEGLAGESVNPVSILYSATAVQQRVIAGNTVNIGKIIGGTTVNTGTSVSTTGDNNHYTAVQVAGTSSNSGNGLSVTGSATNFAGAGTGTRTVSGAITGSGNVSGNLYLDVGTLENGGAGLAGEGSYGPVAVHYTADVLSHADGQFLLPSPNPDPSYPTDYNYTPTTADKSVSPDGKTANIDFKTVWSTPNADPYPVYSYIDLSNLPGDAADLRLTGLSFTDLGHPAGTTPPNWHLQVENGTTWSDLTTSNFSDLAATAVANLRVEFDSNDPALYAPNTPFLATWALSFQDELGVAGGYYGSDPSLDGQYQLTINASAVAIPLPVSALMGSGLLGFLGVGRMVRTRRLRSQA